jgi:hypothetical protein
MNWLALTSHTCTRQKHKQLLSILIILLVCSETELPTILHIIFIYFNTGGWSPYWVHSALRPLLYLPRVIVRMGKLVEWTVLAGETDPASRRRLLRGPAAIVKGKTVLSSERAPTNTRTWMSWDSTDRQSQCDFDLNRGSDRIRSRPVTNQS